MVTLVVYLILIIAYFHLFEFHISNTVNSFYKPIESHQSTTLYCAKKANRQKPISFAGTEPASSGVLCDTSSNLVQQKARKLNEIRLLTVRVRLLTAGSAGCFQRWLFCRPETAATCLDIQQHRGTVKLLSKLASSPSPSRRRRHPPTRVPVGELKLRYTVTAASQTQSQLFHVARFP